MRQKLYFPIVFKLIILITAMLITVTLGVSYKSAEQFEKISTDREESTNLDVADSISAEVDNLVQSYTDKINFYSIESMKENNFNEDSTNLSLFNDPEFYGLIIKHSGQDKGHANLATIINKKSVRDDQVGQLEEMISRISQDLISKDILTFEGKIQIYNMSYSTICLFLLM